MADEDNIWWALHNPEGKIITAWMWDPIELKGYYAKPEDNFTALYHASITSVKSMDTCYNRISDPRGGRGFSPSSSLTDILLSGS